MALLMGALVKRKRGQLMKILIVGGVAAGTKAAAKLKRLNPAADVTSDQGKGHLLRGLRTAVLCRRADSGKGGFDRQYTGEIHRPHRR